MGSRDAGGPHWTGTQGGQRWLYCRSGFTTGYHGAQMVKDLLAIQETPVRSLGQEDPLEKGMTNHSSILAWRIPWTEEPGRLHSMGSQTVGHAE